MKHIILSLITATLLLFTAACDKLQDLNQANTSMPNSVQMNVTTIPVGAKIFVNSKEIGVSPISIPIRPDVSVTISTKMEGYRRANKVCNARTNASNNIHFNLRQITGSLAITSDPSGADVSIDGKPQGPTPLILSQLQPKTYSIVISRPGFSSQSTLMTIPPDGEPVWHKFLLISVMSELSIQAVDDEGEPISGANILIDGKAAGTTPYKTETPEGTYNIVVESDGYTPVERTVTLQRNRPMEEKIILTPKPGEIAISSEPVGANLSINGQQIGVTPYTATGLKPGAYKISVSLDGYDQESQTIVLGKAASLSHNFTLSTNQGGIQLDAMPMGSKVLINGKMIGYIEQSKADPFKSAIFNISNLPAGTHEIEIVHREGSPRSQKTKINVEKGKTSQASLLLWAPNVKIQLTNGSVKEGRLVKKDNNSITFEPQKGVRRSYTSSDYIKIEPIFTKEH